MKPIPPCPPRSRKRLPKHTGFTLVEVMVSMVLISMLCLGVFAGLQQISKAMMGVAIRDEGYHLLQAESERLLSSDYSNFAASKDTAITSSLKTSYSPGSEAALTIPKDNARGRISFTRRVVSVASTATSRTLRVEVEWTWEGRKTTISAPLYRTQS